MVTNLFSESFYTLEIDSFIYELFKSSVGAPLHPIGLFQFLNQSYFVCSSLIQEVLDIFLSFMILVLLDSSWKV